MASLAQDESRKTSIRVKSGQQISMEKGVFYGNGNILGYDRVEKIVEGNKKQVDFNINPVQAETVRRIFDMYLEGHGLMAIKNEMERTGRRTATGLPNWHCTGISQTLKNSFYCGIITYHKECPINTSNSCKSSSKKLSKLTKEVAHKKYAQPTCIY